MEQTFEQVNLGANGIAPSSEQRFEDMSVNNVQPPVSQIPNTAAPAATQQVSANQQPTYTTTVVSQPSGIAVNTTPVQTTVTSNVNAAANNGVNNVAVDPGPQNTQSVATNTPIETEKVVNTTIAQDATTSVETAQPQSAVSTEPANTAPVINSKFVISGAELKHIVKVIKIAAISEVNIPLSSVIELQLSAEGLVARGTDQSLTVTYRNPNLQFTQSLTIDIDIELLSKLAAATLDSDVVEIDPHAEQNYIVLLIGEGRFIFQQRMDESGERVVISTICNKPNVGPIKLDYPEFKARLARACDYAASIKTDNNFAGVWIRDKFVACDGTNGYVEPNLPVFNQYSLLVNKRQADALLALDFENDAEISFEITDNGKINSIHVSDGVIYFECFVGNNESQYNIDSILATLESSYDSYITFDSTALGQLLPRVIPFVNASKDNGMAILSIDNGILTFDTMDHTGHQSFLVSGNITHLDKTGIDIGKLNDALSICPDKNITVGIKEGRFLCITSGDTRQMLSLQNVVS